MVEHGHLNMSIILEKHIPYHIVVIFFIVLLICVINCALVIWKGLKCIVYISTVVFKSFVMTVAILVFILNVVIFIWHRQDCFIVLLSVLSVLLSVLSVFHTKWQKVLISVTQYSPLWCISKHLHII